MGSVVAEPATLSAAGTKGATGEAVLDAPATITVTGDRGDWVFSPPTVREAPLQMRRHRLFSRLKLDVGIAVLKQGGAYRPVRNPSPEELETADVVYLGGHNHVVSDGEYLSLVDAGYGPYLRQRSA